MVQEFPSSNWISRKNRWYSLL